MIHESWSGADNLSVQVSGDEEAATTVEAPPSLRWAPHHDTDI